MKSIRLQELKYQPLRIPAGWAMSYNSFYDLDPGLEVYVEGLPDGNAWGLFSQDMLQLKNEHHDILVDLGWVPDEDPNGSYLVTVIRGTDWHNELETYTSPSRLATVEAIERLLMDVSAGKYRVRGR